MIRLLLILSIGVFVSSCRDEVNTASKPSDLIPRDTLVSVLCDMMIVESHVQIKYQSVVSYHKVMKKSGDQVLKKYRMNYDRFDRSMTYYGGRKIEMQSIYTEVMDSLNRISGQLEQKGVKPLNPNQDTIIPMMGI